VRRDAVFTALLTGNEDTFGSPWVAQIAQQSHSDSKIAAKTRASVLLDASSTGARRV